MSQVILVAGMHRSGTSLLARYLAESGVDMGKDLLGAHTTNPAGHYEDPGMLAWHQKILALHNMDHRVSDDINWQIPAEMKARALELIAERSVQTIWGWKDPRTSLFLDFWTTLLPGAFVLATYRNYRDTVSSLITRDLAFYREKTSLLHRLKNPLYSKAEIPNVVNTYLRTWIHYNTRILDYVERSSKHSILLPFGELASGDFSRLQALKDWGILLNFPKKFRHSQSKSRVTARIGIAPDPELAAQADMIDMRFHKILSLKKSN